MLQCEKSAGNTVIKFAAVIRHCVEMYCICYIHTSQDFLFYLPFITLRLKYLRLGFLGITE